MGGLLRFNTSTVRRTFYIHIVNINNVQRINAVRYRTGTSTVVGLPWWRSGGRPDGGVVPVLVVIVR